MFYKDNWLTWYYNDVNYGSKLNTDSVFDIKIKPVLIDNEINNVINKNNFAEDKSEFIENFSS